MAVAFDAASSGHAGTAGAPSTTASWSHTGASGAALVVDACISKLDTDVSAYTVTVTYGGVSMTSSVRQAPGSNTSFVEKFVLLNACDGTAKTVLITVSTAAEIAGGSKSYTGAGSFGTGVGSAPGIATNSGTLNVTSSTNDMVDFCAAHGDLITNPGIGGTGTQRWLENWQQDTAGGCGVGGSYPGAATVATSALSGVSDHWTLVAVNVVASGGATAAPDSPAMPVPLPMFAPTPSVALAPVSPLAWWQGVDQPAGSTGTTFPQALSGTTTPTGVMVKLVAATRTGTLTPAGALAKADAKPLAGTITSTGALLKQASKAFAGTITPTGAVTFLRVALRTFTATITPAGTVVKLVSKPLAGTATSAGTLAKQTGKPLAGTLTPTGTLVKKALKTLAGTVTPTGTVTFLKVLLRTFTGTVTSSGALVKQASKNVAGTVTPSGTVARAALKLLTGIVTSSGTITKAVSKKVTGTITPAGAVTFLRVLLRAFAGTITSSGALTRLTGKGVAGTVTPTGGVTKRSITKTIAGVLAPAGSLRKTIARALVGLIAPSGSLIQGSQGPPDYTLPPHATSGIPGLISGSDRSILTGRDTGGDIITGGTR
jgi:hypothetical protein